MKVRIPLMVQDQVIAVQKAMPPTETTLLEGERFFLDGPVTRIAGPDVPAVPYNHVLEDWFMVNPEKIADGLRKLAAY